MRYIIVMDFGSGEIFVFPAILENYEEDTIQEYLRGKGFHNPKNYYYMIQDELKITISK